MNDYRKWRKSVGIDNATMTHALEEKYKGYSKITASMINQPSKYGLKLTKEAEKYLAEKFGYGNGLTISKPKKRSKPKQLTVRVPETLYESIQTKLDGCTIQDYILKLLEKE